MAPARPLVYLAASMRIAHFLHGLLHRPSTRPLRAVAATLLMVVAAIPASRPLAAQEDGVRMGVTVGGSGLIGVTLEVLGRHRSLELTVGTFSFGDIGVSLAAKEHFGASALRPSLGAGLWLMMAPAHPEDPAAERSGLILLARVPLGFDWHMTDHQYLTFDINTTRALWIRRPDPTDDRPTSETLVPIPALGYRWRF